MSPGSPPLGPVTWISAASGDAAHAMSPIGGVGVNLAVQDAVATANILALPLLERNVSDADLARVQKRRTFPVTLTQRIQVFLQDRVIKSVLAASEVPNVPFPLKILNDFPLLRRIPGRSSRRRPAT